MPTRTVLEALYNTDRWSGWTRHFGPPGRLSSQIEDRQRRCILTTFAVGSGLGATQAARHFDEPISPQLKSFVQRRRMGTGSLRAACVDVLNQYAKFELPIYGGTADKVAADGYLLTICSLPAHYLLTTCSLPAHYLLTTCSLPAHYLLTTCEDNIQATHHVRYRRTGAVAYRHVGSNYIACFTNLIVAGAYEGAYLFKRGISVSTERREALEPLSDPAPVAVRQVRRELQNGAATGQFEPELLSYPQAWRLFP